MLCPPVLDALLVTSARVKDYTILSRLLDSVKSVPRHSGLRVIFYCQNTPYLVLPHHAVVSHVTIYHRP
jgi:hypothetical protein